MDSTSLRRLARAARARVIYRLDTWLTYPPVGQLLGLVFATGVMVLIWALVLRGVAPRSPDAASDREALWWSLTHLMDGGTMASDHWGQRLVALGATASGVLLLSLVTAAFASKMNERIHDMRSGLNPVVERDHILVLGFSGDATLVAREIARSGQRRTLVVLAQSDKLRIEMAMRHVTQTDGTKVRVAVRTGDPRSEAALLRVDAQHAKSIVVVPPPELDDEESVQWTLSTLLAVRRVVESDFAGEIIVEARHAENRDVLMLAAEPGIAGPNALSTQIVASDDIIARVLAQGARQEGVYFALRELLAFNRREIYIADVPEPLRGLSFDDAHARLRDGVLLGIVRKGGPPILSPRPDAAIVLSAGDRMVLLSSGRADYRLDGTLPDAPDNASLPAPLALPPERVVILGFNRIIPLLVTELDELLPAGSRIHVVSGDTTKESAPVLDAARRAVKRSTVTVIERSPCESMRTNEAEIYEADAVIIVGCADDAGDNGDADALANLLWLRHGMRRTGRHVHRVVTQVRDPRSALHVPEMPHDFVVSSAVVAMLLAQAALDPDAARVYTEILNPEGAEIFLRPRAEYLGVGPRTFADAMASARTYGEIALGFMTADPDADDDCEARREQLAVDDASERARRTLQLNPPREVSVPEGPRAYVVVLTHHAR